MIVIARSFNPTTFAPLATLERWRPGANNSMNSLGLVAEGGTIRQSFFINCSTDAPFNIELNHLYQSDDTLYGTDIQLMGESKKKFASPLGTPRLRFYVCSPSTSERYTSLETDTDGNDILVSHLTADEFLNDFSAAVTALHASGAGVTTLDNFLQSFDIICNIGSEDSDGNITYSNLYYNDPSQAGKRHKIDFLVYAELPYNNTSAIDTDYPIGVSASEYVVVE